MEHNKKKIDVFAVYLGFAMLMTFLLDTVCVVYLYTHNSLSVEVKDMFTFMIGMFSSLFGVEAVMGVINNISKRNSGSEAENNG